ncbi:hypothetical protein DFO70_104371 [Cytobacillus firmus]|uniref:Uncharacterized protein n=2 Tax=Cytobacillus TaxID=2675230 RepID=A0A366K0Q2_CYTFI|nr:hypothetical protein DFO70_104371 [Cytobacillus firmus]TDX43473.1 hypothetical protein DFO72_105372 [Cytobacillus oceanisediminis]
MNNIQIFNELHFSNELLFLGNAWDLLIPIHQSPQ